MIYSPQANLREVNREVDTSFNIFINCYSLFQAPRETREGEGERTKTREDWGREKENNSFGCGSTTYMIQLKTALFALSRSLDFLTYGAGGCTIVGLQEMESRTPPSC